MVGVKYPTFALWVQKRRKDRKCEGAAEANAVTFAEAVIDRNAGAMIGAPGLTIELPGGARLLVQLPVQLPMAAELLRLVAGGAHRRKSFNGLEGLVRSVWGKSREAEHCSSLRIGRAHA